MIKDVKAYPAQREKYHYQKYPVDENHKNISGEYPVFHNIICYELDKSDPYQAGQKTNEN